MRTTPGLVQARPIPSWKRLLDLLLLLLLSPLLVPVTAITALLVRTQLGSPLFYKQERPGHGGKPFTMYKFRTMTDKRGADGELLPDDQRLTRLGRLLRASSLDELPEVYSVLTGEMSFVGPRPLPMEYLPLYSTEQARRHELPPGIAGWAQLHDGSDTSWQAHFVRDVWYIDNAGPLLDLTILVIAAFRTIVRRSGPAPGASTRVDFTGDQ